MLKIADILIFSAELKAVQAGADCPGYKETFSDDYFNHQMKAMETFVKVCKLRMETLALADKAIAIGETLFRPCLSLHKLKFNVSAGHEDLL